MYFAVFAASWQNCGRGVREYNKCRPNRIRDAEEQPVERKCAGVSAPVVLSSFGKWNKYYMYLFVCACLSRESKSHEHHISIANI